MGNLSKKEIRRLHDLANSKSGDVIALMTKVDYNISLTISLYLSKNNIYDLRMLLPLIDNVRNFDVKKSALKYIINHPSHDDFFKIYTRIDFLSDIKQMQDLRNLFAHRCIEISDTEDVILLRKINEHDNKKMYDFKEYKSKSHPKNINKLIKINETLISFGTKIKGD